MKARWIWSALTAGAVMLAAGTAFSGGNSTTDNQLVDYNQQTGELWAYPSNQGLTSYLHQPTTVHLLADLTKFAPPDPCRELAQTWNEVVIWEAEHPRWTEHHAKQSERFFSGMLTVMADYQCRATVNSVTTGAPQPIITIAPSAN